MTDPKEHSNRVQISIHGYWDRIMNLRKDAAWRELPMAAKLRSLIIEQIVHEEHRQGKHDD